MRNLILFLIPLALIAAGCGPSSTESDEEFLESIQTAAEVAPPSEYKSPTMLINIDGPMPDIEVETDHFVMPGLPGDKISEGTVKVRNRGDAPLEIKNVTTSCQCTKGRIEQAVIEAGGEVDMIVSIDPSLIPGFEATRVLTIETNDPDMPAYSVAVTSYVNPEVQLAPESGNLGAVMAGKGMERRFILRQLQEAPFEILAARSTHHFMEISFAELPSEQWLKPDHREYELVLTVKPDAPVGRLDSKISLETNLQRTRRLQYDLTGVVHVNPYSMVPRTSITSDVAPGTTIDSAFRLTAEGPVVLKSTNADGYDLQLIARQTDAPNELVFDVLLDQDTAPGRVQQVWDISFDINGTVFTDQLMAVVNTPAVMPESD